MTDLDASINSRQEVGGLSLVGNWDIGPGNGHVGDGVALLGLAARQRPRLHWTAHHHGFAESVAAEAVLAGAAFGVRMARTSSTTPSGHSTSTQTINTQGSQVQGSAASRWLLNPGNVAVERDALRHRDDGGLQSVGARWPDVDQHDQLRATQSFAVFAKLNWKVTDKLHLQPGLRVNYDQEVRVSTIRSSASPTRNTISSRPRTMWPLCWPRFRTRALGERPILN